MDHFGLFLNDTWSFGRTTVNAGVRYDRYQGWLPEQEQIGATVGRASVPAATFAERNLFTWNEVAPRLGVVFDLGGDGKTVLKANYGLYYHNPGVTQSDNANPNTADKSSTWGWNDVNGDRRWQPGEETTLISESLQGGIEIDPAISAPWTHEASAWVERQLTETMGMRAGFVYKNENNLFTPNNYQPLRGPSTYTAPFTFIDNGVDGVRGTADDRNIPMLGFPTANAGQFPATIIVGNVDQFAHYKTIEVSMNKRYANRWSASVGGNYTMLRDFPNNYAAEPEPAGPGGSFDVELQGDGQLRRAVRHPYFTGAAAPVGRELRAHHRRCRRPRRPASAWPAPPPTPSRRMRIAKTTSPCSTFARRRASSSARGSASAPISICSTSRTATRRKRSRARRDCSS